MFSPGGYIKNIATLQFLLRLYSIPFYLISVKIIYVFILKTELVSTKSFPSVISLRLAETKIPSWHLVVLVCKY